MRQKKEHSGRYAFLIGLMVLAILGAAGYYGWLWWEGRQQAAPAVAQQPASTQPAATTTTPAPTTTGTTDTTGTIVEMGTSTDTTAATQTTPVPAPGGLTVTPGPATTTVATTTTSAPPRPAPAAVTVSAEPPPTQALPRVTARSTTTTPAPAGGAARDRVDVKAREFASRASGNFTVQIQILCDASNVEKLMRDGGDNVWFVPQSIGTRPCYRVFWGRYNTRDQAQQAMAGIPGGIRDRNAAVKPVPKG